MKEERTYVSRAGAKLEHALRAFAVDADGLVCADFGANVGGFTHCLLEHGAAHVYAVDTGYGTLAYTLRTDERVTVMERTNALHAESPEGGVDLVVVDLGWTPQARAIPPALEWLKPGGRIISLIKPHYELTADEKRAHFVRGQLDPAIAERIAERAVDAMPTHGAEARGLVKSPITGGKSSRRGAGNVEYLTLLTAR